MIRALLARELQHVLANPMQVVNPLAFLFLSVTLFAIALPETCWVKAAFLYCGWLSY